jgi:hypothetical protein
MTRDAEQLMAAALKSIKLNGSFCPIEVGAKAGMEKWQAEAAARALSNAGILVLGFDSAAHFSPDFRKSQAKLAPKAGRTKKKARQLA